MWHARRKSEPKRPGRKRKPVPEALAEEVRAVACEFPWWGFKRIVVVARRAGVEVSNKQVYKVMKAAGLLQKRRVRNAELKASGVADVLIAVVDRLKGVPEAIEAVFPRATVQSYIVHLIRRALAYAS